MRFAVIGGDMRHVKLAELLADDGHQVRVFGQDKIMTDKRIYAARGAGEAVRDAQCIVLPLPVTSRDDILNSPFDGSGHNLEEIFKVTEPGTVVCGGRVDAISAGEAEKYGIEIIDYLKREEMAVKNAAATAEGALQILMEELPITVNGAKCLVIGYGRIGKLLSELLKACGARVTVSARKYSDMAWIEARGHERLNTERLEGKLGGYDAVINTVPAMVLPRERLRELGKGCFCLDLASKPGGVDFQAASGLGIKAVWALGLPGEVAPVTSGKIIRDTIYNILNELGMTT